MNVPPAPPAIVASPSPAPSPSASASGPSDPCTSMSSLVSRPSVSTSGCSVKVGNLLMESGYSNVSISGGGNTVTYPQGAVRAGLLGKLEFDIDPPSVERQTGAASGVTDSGIGLHYEFGYTGKLVYAANAVYTIANGSPQFSANGDGALLNLEGSYTLSPAFSVFGTAGYETQAEGGVSNAPRYRAFLPALGVTLTLPAGYDVFFEGFGQSINGPGQSGRYAYDFAVQKDIGTRLQLDANFFEYPAASSGPHQTSTGFGVSYLVGPSSP